MLNRRLFLTQSLGPACALLLARGKGSGQSQAASTHPNLAAIDHDRILAAAGRALTMQPQPIAGLPCPRSPGAANDFYSEPENPEPALAFDLPAPNAPNVRREMPRNPNAFTAHRDALFAMSQLVAALAAATLLTRTSAPEQASRYSAHAALHLRAWFLDPGSRMNPSLPYAGRLPDTSTGSFQGILDTLPLAEVAQAIPFLAPAIAETRAIPEPDLAGLKAWFTDYLRWLTDTRLAILAMDQKDHHGASWMMQTASFAHLSGNDAALSTLRHRYKTVTVRAQIAADGAFPHELTTPNPYRMSLFNLDMLAGICNLLSTPFDSVWDHQLQDGPGMRVAIARHVPFIQNRGAWPFLADRAHFTDLPARRPSLLLAGRAYQRPEYIDLFRSLSPDPTSLEIARTIPMQQPILWVSRPNS